jgi:hypothetical protein
VLHELRDYAALFTAAEKAVAAQFALLPPTARALYARLQLRKGPWFRVDSMLHYDECSEDTPAWLVLRRQRSLQLDESETSTTTAATVYARGVSDGARSESTSDTQVRSPFLAHSWVYSKIALAHRWLLQGTHYVHATLKLY